MGILELLNKWEDLWQPTRLSSEPPTAFVGRIRFACGSVPIIPLENRLAGNPGYEGSNPSLSARRTHSGPGPSYEEAGAVIVVAANKEAACPACYATRSWS